LAAHCHIVAARDCGDFALHAHADLAFLGKTGRKNDGRFDTSPPAALKLCRRVLRRDDQNREIGRFGQGFN